MMLCLLRCYNFFLLFSSSGILTNNNFIMFCETTWPPPAPNPPKKNKKINRSEVEQHVTNTDERRTRLLLKAIWAIFIEQQLYGSSSRGWPSGTAGFFPGGWSASGQVRIQSTADGIAEKHVQWLSTGQLVPRCSWGEKFTVLLKFTHFPGTSFNKDHPAWETCKVDVIKKAINPFLN